MKNLEGEKLLQRVELYTRIALIVLLLAGWFIGNSKVVFSILVGGILIVGNFEILKRQLVKALNKKEQVPSKVGLFVRYYIRFAILALIILFLIKKGIVHPLWLLVGLSSVMLGITFVAITEFIKIFMKGEG